MGAIEVKEAIGIILRAVEPLGVETVPLLEAQGRVLGEGLAARRDQPPWDNSAMDGYAVRWEDVDRSPSKLAVIEEIPAGALSKKKVGKGEAARIFTGAPMPEGADTVIRQEDTRAEGATVVILKSSHAGEHVRPRGQDVKTGQPVLPSGAVMRPAMIGMAAAMGYAQATVHKRPRVAILTTGDELAEPGSPIAPNQIYNSNAYSLAAQVSEAGGEPRRLGPVKDDPKELTERLREALDADAVIVSGGVSVGEYDYVKDVLKSLDMETRFWGVNIRPGHPTLFGTIKNRPIFGIPGNPVSTMVTVELFVRPAVLKMAGHANLFRPVVEATLETEFANRPGRVHFVRVIVNRTETGYTVKPTGIQDSGILLSMVQAQGLMILPADAKTIPAGSRVRVQLLYEPFTERPPI
jgi:molybdopterin molybdotransferase